MSGAFAKVYSLNGSTGSGFFISKDGLFLTNEHVMESAHSLSYSQCPGFQIVTDFTESGVGKSYTDFEVIAYSSAAEKLDAMLIKVKLDEGEKTPFVELELDPSYYGSRMKNAKLTDVGHPAGSPLKSTNVERIETLDNNIASFRAIVFGGNSGGALVDSNTKKVVGLIKQKNDHIRYSEINGEFVPVGIATTIKSLVSEMTGTSDKLEELFDSLEGNNLIPSLSTEENLVKEVIIVDEEL